MFRFDNNECTRLDLLSIRCMKKTLILRFVMYLECMPMSTALCAFLNVITSIIKVTRLTFVVVASWQVECAQVDVADRCYC